MRKELSRGHCSGGWVGSSLRKKAPSSLTKSVNCPRKLKLPCCVFCRSGSLSVWVAISRSELTCGLSPPPIATWRLPSLRVHAVAICFTVSTSSLSRFPLCGKEEQTFPCWLHTSSIISQEKQERASVGSIKELWSFLYRIPGQGIFANYRTSSSDLSLYAKQKISPWMRVGFHGSLLRASRKACRNYLTSSQAIRKR